MTMNDSWGYKENDDNWKSAEMLIHNLIDIAAKGGNYLLNVGPDARGLIPAPSVERLQEMGEWMRQNGEAVKNTSMWEAYEEGASIRYTRGAEGQIYAIALQWPGEALRLKYVRPAPNSEIRLLGYDEPLDWTFDERDGLRISLPGENDRPGAYAWVFRIEGSFPEVAPIPEFVNAKGEVVEEDIFSGTTSVEIRSAAPGAQIYYTTDGSEPVPEEASSYEGPVALSASATLRAIAVLPDALISPVASASFAASPYNGIQVTHPYALQYDGGGPLGLVDGRLGTGNFKDGYWQGFEGADLEAVVDLGESLPVRRVATHFLQDLGVWVFPPKTVRFEVSEDGREFREVAVFEFETPRQQEGPVILTVEEDFSRADATPRGRYVRIRAENVGTCPPWHPGAGGKAWLFVDEIIVE